MKSRSWLGACRRKLELLFRGILGEDGSVWVRVHVSTLLLLVGRPSRGLLPSKRGSRERNPSVVLSER